MKVVFIGHPGSGKTFAARSLAQRTNIQVVDIDDLLHNLVYFFFKGPYRKALTRLLSNKTAWIIDGYGGKRMPASLWDEADHIVYLNLAKPELKQNVYSRYKLKKNNHEHTHGQQLFVNILKNLWQIYVLDHSLQQSVTNIRHSSNAHKLIEVRSRQELRDLVDKLASER
jgi:adenylate kinase family enzyme